MRQSDKSENARQSDKSEHATAYAGIKPNPNKCISSTICIIILSFH